MTRVLSSRGMQAVALLALTIAFVLVRWTQRREPWNSDDMILFEASVNAAEGQHWVFGATPQETANAPHALHVVFRIGLLPVSVPLIELLGASSWAYYLTPLVFSAVGFGTVSWLMLRHFGPLAAFVFAGVHVMWPFELEHSSLFLTDLPAASMGMLSLCFLDASARRQRRGHLVLAVLAGIAAWETYLLRNNGLVLLTPAYFVFFWSRPTRTQTLVATACALVGVFTQQAFLAYRGIGWGYDWTSTRQDFADYAPFLEVYSWSSFLVRQFAYQVSTFGRGATGILAALVIIGSLGVHLLMLRYEQRALLRAVAAFGLFSWLVFSFSIYELVPGGVRATVPVNFRFVQPFTYSSLVVWAWAWTWLRSTAAEQKRSSYARRLVHPALVPALPLALLTFSLMALVVRRPETYALGQTRRLTQALHHHVSDDRQPRKIVGTRASLQVPALLASTELSQLVQWRELNPSELADVVSRKNGELVLRDVPRELTRARYMEPAIRRAYRDELSQIEQTLWRDYALAYVDAKYALFEPSTAGSPANASLELEWQPPSMPLAKDELIKGVVCRVLPDASSWRTLVPARAQGGRTICEKTWAEDGRAEQRQLPEAADTSSGFVLRIHADYEAPLRLTVDVVQHLAGELRRDRVLVPPGTSYVPVRPRNGARAVSLVYRVSTRGAPEGQIVRVRPAEWRSHRFADTGRAIASAPRRRAQAN